MCVVFDSNCLFPPSALWEKLVKCDSMFCHVIITEVWVYVY